MLTALDLTELAGLPVPTLNEWVAKGLVRPAERGGVGRGNAHKFSANQALGLMVAAELHRSPRGCSPALVAEIVAAFSNDDTEEWLAGQFKMGRTHFVGAIYGGKGHILLRRAGDPEAKGGKYPLRPYLEEPPKDDHERKSLGWPDVGAAREKIKAALEEQ